MFPDLIQFECDPRLVSDWGLLRVGVFNWWWESLMGKLVLDLVFCSVFGRYGYFYLDRIS